MMVDAEIHQLMHMGAVSGARIDRQVWEMLPHDLGDAKRVLDIVDREHEGPRLVGLRRPQDVEPPGVAVIDLGAEALHEIDLRDIGIERGERDARARAKYAPRSARSVRSQR